MKVLQINAVYGKYSTGIIVKDIEDVLIRNDDTPFVAYQSANGQPVCGYKIGSNLSWKLHALYTRIFGKQAYASTRATKKFLRWVDIIKPDVVHLHNVHSNFINLNMLLDYLSKNDVATVITLHDCWYFTGKCSHYVLSGCDKWQAECGKCPALKKEVKSLFFDQTSKVLKDKTSHLNSISNLTIVGCSKWIANEVKKSLVKPKNIEVVRNGIDTSIFYPHESDIKERIGVKKDSFMMLGFADKWCYDKNLDTVKSICDTFKDDAIVIAGCNEKHKNFLSQFNNVVCLPYVSDRNFMADLFSSADVFVNLTHADTLPTVNMESICSGTPVVTFDACGSPELVDKDSGFVVKKGDTEGVLSAIEKIKTCGFNIDIESKKTKFDKQTCYKKYLEIYKKATEKQ